MKKVISLLLSLMMLCSFPCFFRKSFASTPEDYSNKSFSCISAIINGEQLEASQLDGVYRMILSESGIMHLTIADVEIPDELPWSYRTDMIEGRETTSIVIDYYGLDLIAIQTDEGLLLNYFDAMLMLFTLDESIM